MSSLTQLFLSPLASPSCPSPDSLLLSVSTVLDVLLSFTPPVPPFPLHLLHPPLVFPSHILCSHLASVIVSLLSPPNLPIPPHTYFSPHLPLFFPPRPPIFASFPLVFLSFPRPIIHLPFTSPPFCLPPQPPPLPALSLCREARHCRANPC